MNVLVLGDFSDIHTNPSQRGTSVLSATIPSSSAAQETPDEFKTGLIQLALVVDSIKTLSLGVRSLELLALAHQAVQVTEERSEDDLESWAGQLGRELSDQND